MILQPYDFLGEFQVSLNYSRASRRTCVLLDKGEERARPFLESYLRNTRMNVSRVHMKTNISQKIVIGKERVSALYYGQF